MGIFEFIRDNFLHVVPILVAGFIAVAIIFERAQTLFKTYTLPAKDAFFDKARELVSKGQMNEALALCQQFSGKPTAEIVKVAIERAHQPEELIMNSVELTRNKYAELIQKRTSYLATIANVATLLGLLGTIAGLIESFAAVGHADAQQKAQLLANGISTAMNATMLGLGVAVPCMIVFSFYINKANRLVAELESAGLMALDSIMVCSLNQNQNDRRVS
ncbi:MAG: MotA/TolQ/ExbB proton channel family protein [Bdellovibrionales bacterium]|nr:MotA/TolQ/ExbB proton channel family protein [Bdellovibrionales bacterium]